MPGFMSRAVSVLALAVLLNLASSYFGLNFSSFSSSKPAPVSQDALGLTLKPVKLYGSPMSTCTRRVAVVLKEKGVPYELIPIDLSKGEHKKPEFLENFQPFGQVPILQDGDFIIYESRAIGRYIATKYASFGTPSLIPPQTDLTAWARFEEAASIEQNNFDPYASGIAVEKVFKLMKGGITDEKRVNDLTETLRAKMDVYDKILSKRKYLAGDNITLADLYHLSYGTMLTELGSDALTSRPNVARWWNDISSRESWKSVKGGA